MALISSLADFTSLSIMFVVFCCRNFALIMKIIDMLPKVGVCNFLTISKISVFKYVDFKKSHYL